MGDFNLEIQDSQILREVLQQQFWFDARPRGEQSEVLKATCHKSTGSKIDHIFVSPSLIDHFSHFPISTYPEFKDHSLVAGKLACPSPAQMRTSLRPVADLPPLRVANSQDTKISCQLDEKFGSALQSKNVDLAFKLWTQELERILFAVAKLPGHIPPATAAAKRGQVLFHEQRKHPKVIAQQASTLLGRKLWKAHCQVQEILVASNGTRKDRAIANLWSVLPFLHPNYAEPFKNALCCSNFQEVAAVIKLAMNANERDDRQQRITEWKRSIRKDISSSYQHLRRKASKAPTQVSFANGQITANISDRLRSIEAVWKKVYSTHKNGEPTLRRLLEIYGPSLKSSKSNLGQLTTANLRTALNKMRPSSSGLDQILTSELQVAISWSPMLLDHLTSLYQTIEDINRWPANLTKGAVAFIPKEPEKDAPLPEEFRPITILSCIYRLWAAARHLQLAQRWFPSWKHDKSFGGKFSSSADQLALETCLQLADAYANGEEVAGLSFDLRKCFDTVPVGLALDLMLTRGCDPPIVQTLRSFYNQHTKFFRLDGHHSQAFKPSCGIIQGCPLSMLILTSLVTCWLEYNDAKIPVAVSRSYADDMSSVVVDQNKASVKDGLQQVFQSTQQFTSVAGLCISKSKTFTFGNNSFKQSVAQIQDHQTVFRLVGCCVKISHSPSWSPIEQKRLVDWTKVVQRVQNLPQSWQVKTHILQSVMSKLTYGQGMKMLHVSKDTMRSMRATVVRALLNTWNYNSAPNIIFSFLAPPSIDPAFALPLSAFLLFKRSEMKHDLLQKLNSEIPLADGPLASAKQLFNSPFFGPTMKAFLENQLQENKWPHNLREDYRQHLLDTLARDRPQHYAGISSGINRRATCIWLHQLQMAADDLQKKCDNEEVIAPEAKADPRAQLKVLRLLFSGGLQNPERAHRHKKHKGKVLCLCKKDEPSLHHISWHCSRFQHIRQGLCTELPCSLEQLPECFRSCAIVPKNFHIPDELIIKVQRILVEIWQSHVDDWYNSPENFLVVSSVSAQPQAEMDPLPNYIESPSAPQASASGESQPVPRNGHVLQIMDSGGVFCRKCGKSTKLQKHQRLKITSKPCVNADLLADQWLGEPGAMSNRHRLEKAWVDLRKSYNKARHQLFWNQKCGKDKNKPRDFGRLWCETCGREWARMHRHNNLVRTHCITPSVPPVPPTWVRNVKTGGDLFVFAPLHEIVPPEVVFPNPIPRNTKKTLIR